MAYLYSSKSLCYNWVMRIQNRKYQREYSVIETFEAGISLTGEEVKSIRAQQLRLDDAFVRIMEDGPYLINADIPVYRFASAKGYQPRRSRKLLLHKKELLRLKVKLQAAKGLTIVPIACYNKGPLFKLEIGLAKGRTDLEKRKLEKARDVKRAIDKEIREYEKY